MRRAETIGTVADLPNRRDAMAKMEEQLREVNHGTQRPHSPRGSRTTITCLAAAVVGGLCLSPTIGAQSIDELEAMTVAT